MNFIHFNQFWAISLIIEKADIFASKNSHRRQIHAYLRWLVGSRKLELGLEPEQQLILGRD
jgi:hypothetical protein